MKAKVNQHIKEEIQYVKKNQKLETKKLKNLKVAN